MIYLLHGADRFGSVARLRELRHLTDPSGFNGVSLDGAEVELDALRAACDTLAFFGGGRCVDVRGVLTRWSAKGGDPSPRSGGSAPSRSGGAGTGAKGDGSALESLAAYLPAMPATTTLIFWEPGPVELPTPLRRALQDLSAAVERFDAPRGRELRDWVVAQAREAGATIRPDAAEALLDALCAQGWREAPRGRPPVPPDLLRLDSELRKLATAVLGREEGPGAVITARDVAVHTVGETESNVFDLVDAVAAGNARAALARLREGLDNGIVPEAILPLLAGQFGTMARLRAIGGAGARPDAALAGRLGVNPYRLQHAARQLAQFGEARVGRALAVLTEADEAIKTGRSPRSDDALYWAVLELCRVGPSLPLIHPAGDA